MQLKICYLIMVALAILVHVTLALPLHLLDSKLQPPDSKMVAYGKLKELQMQIERDLQDINKRVEALPLGEDDLDKMLLKDAMLDVKKVLRRMIRKAQVNLDDSVLPPHQHGSHPWGRAPTSLHKRGLQDAFEGLKGVKKLFTKGKKDKKTKPVFKVPPPIPGERPGITHDDLKRGPRPGMVVFGWPPWKPSRPRPVPSQPLRFDWRGRLVERDEFVHDDANHHQDSFNSSASPSSLHERGCMDCWKGSFETVKSLFKKDEKRKQYTKIPPPIPGPRPAITHEDVKKDPEPPRRPPRKYPWLPWYTPHDLGRPRPGRPESRPTPPPPFYFNRHGQLRVERPGEPREW